MSKPKRNDPCPCGSGKKYKKCCGATNVIELSPSIYNDELESLHQELLSLVINSYEEEMTKLIEDNFQPFIVTNKDLTDVYTIGLTFWAVFNVPLFKNNQTIFDSFYNRMQSKINRTITRNTFAKWGNATPSVYEVISIDEQLAHQATIREVITNEMYQIPYTEDDHFHVGNLAIGTLLPYVQHYDFFFTMIEISTNKRETIMEILDTYLSNYDDLGEIFPDFLAEILMIDAEVMEWENPIHEMVAQLFTKHMEEKGFDDDIISSGVMLWHMYCETENPYVKKLGAYAAAMDYLVQTTLLDDTTITQTQLAKEYGTSAGTVSTNFRKILDVLGDEIDTIMDEMMGEEIMEEPKFLSTPKSPGSFNMEREMRDITKILEEQNFSTKEEANDFLTQLLQNNTKPAALSISPRDQAQDLIYEAWEVTGKKRRKLIKEALNIYPNTPDAYLLMAEDAGSIKEQTRLLSKAVSAGEQDLGQAFFKENKGHFWMMIETRPFMRAKAAYANHLEDMGFMEEAITQYEELLELNPNDNQGVRYLLLTLYIEAGLYEKANGLIQQYDDDETASFLFNKALLHYLTNGITSKTKALLKKAHKQNPYVKDYLLGKKKVPNKSFEYIGFGDETEAIAYTQENSHLWQDNLVLLKELR